MFIVIFLREIPINMVETSPYYLKYGAVFYRKKIGIAVVFSLLPISVLLSRSLSELYKRPTAMKNHREFQADTLDNASLPFYKSQQDSYKQQQPTALNQLRTAQGDKLDNASLPLSKRQQDSYKQQQPTALNQSRTAQGNKLDNASLPLSKSQQDSYKQPQPTALNQPRTAQGDNLDNASLPFYKRQQDSCESIFNHATFRPHDNINTNECTLRTFSHEEFQRCISKREKKFSIWFVGDSRVRYKYRQFAVNYIKPGAPNTTCGELPSLWGDKGLNRSEREKDFSCNSTSVISVFWWTKVLNELLIDRLKNIPPMQRPDIVVGSVWPWYCLKPFTNQTPFYQRNLEQLVKLISSWKNTTLLYFMQEHTQEIRSYPWKTWNNFNQINVRVFKNPPERVKYVRSTFDFQLKFGLVDFLHVADKADLWTTTLLVNYICRVDDTHQGQHNRYCC